MKVANHKPTCSRVAHKRNKAKLQVNNFLDAPTADLDENGEVISDDEI